MSHPAGTVLTLAARWIFPVDAEPLADGCIDIRDGKIVGIGPRTGRIVDFDYGNAGISPGFVNAHCHLELAALENDDWSASDPPQNEVQWLQRLVKQRWQTDPESYSETAAQHSLELVHSGTTLVADITTAGASGPALAETPIRSVIFAEIIGLKRLRALTMNEAAWAWINAVDPVLKRDRPTDGTFRQKLGISPHAPYSTAGWLYHQAARSGLPLTTHIAEMSEELEFISDGTGPLRDFLEEIGAWPEDESWEPLGSKPLEYVRGKELRSADWLLAHCNYIDENDLWQFAPAAQKPDQRFAVVYCPRTSARFGHLQNPYQKILERGGIVCLGTDSRASAPTLSVLDEMRFLHQNEPDLSPRLILAMGTLFGAWALRADHFSGTLKVGHSADLAVMALPDRDEGSLEPESLIMNSNLPVVATWLEGTPVFELQG